jgi:hypothetical protein
MVVCIGLQQLQLLSRTRESRKTPEPSRSVNQERTPP